MARQQEKASDPVTHDMFCTCEDCILFWEELSEQAKALDDIDLFINDEE